MGGAEVTPRGFWAAAEAAPDRLAVVDADGRSHLAGDVLARSNALVHLLRDRGLGRGDVVATLSTNRVEVLEVLLAVFQAGLSYVPINTHLTAREASHILADSGASALVADADHADLAVEAATRAGTPASGRLAVGDVDGFDPLDAALADQPTSPPQDRASGQFMQYTSGTTGRPKAVIRDQPWVEPELWVAGTAANLTRYDIEPGGDGVHLVTSPMYHLAPLAFGLFSLHFEHTVVLMGRWEAEEALRLVERHRVTDTHMVPTQLHRLMLLPPEVRTRYDVSSLRSLVHAAAPCPVDLKRRLFDWLGPVIYEFYGATEGGGTLARPHEWLARPGTVGRPWEGAGVRVLDDDGNELPPGEIGTVYLKLMGDFAYKGDPRKTAAGRRAGWFTVGDMGELDADGYLYLRDRKVDMIISGGVNVYPAEVEGVLLSHPAVGDCAVFGIPHDDRGEEVKAVVEPAPGHEAGEPLAAALLAHCREQLAGYKCPRSIDFVEVLPRDPNGKLAKRLLRDPYWADREGAI
jgi:long-chain acyl-CoA synthetase